MKVSLVVQNAGKASGQAIPITLPEFVIGRDPQCNLRPSSVLISKRHCAVLTRNGQIAVRDFDSTNGTFVNEKQIKGEVALQDGDVLKVGPLAFKVQVEGKLEKPTPPPATGRPTVKKPTPVPAKSGVHDDDAAALLLSLEDTPEDAAATLDSKGVPEGSTVMDLPTSIPTPTPPTKETAVAPAEPADAVAAPNGSANGEAEKDKKPSAGKAPTGAAQMAAKAILEKYSKRSR